MSRFITWIALAYRITTGLADVGQAWPHFAPYCLRIDAISGDARHDWIVKNIGICVRNVFGALPACYPRPLGATDL